MEQARCLPPAGPVCAGSRSVMATRVGHEPYPLWVSASVCWDSASPPPKQGDLCVISALTVSWSCLQARLYRVVQLRSAHARYAVWRTGLRAGLARTSTLLAHCSIDPTSGQPGHPRVGDIGEQRFEGRLIDGAVGPVQKRVTAEAGAGSLLALYSSRRDPP